MNRPDTINTLVTARFTQESLERLEARIGRVRRAGFGISGKKLDEEVFLNQVEDLEYLIVEFEPVTARILDKAKHLRIAACCRNEPAASFDLEAATERGIPVLFPPGRNAVSVAEYTMGLMLAVSRKIAEAHHELKYTDSLTSVTYDDKTKGREGITSEWSLAPGAPFHLFQGPELYGKTMGMIGCGRIGRELAARAIAFGMTVLVADPYISNDEIKRIGASRIELPELPARSDFLVVAAKVTAETRGLVSEEIIGRMKASAYFINTARAAVVDYDALCQALDEGRIAGAALDVYPKEPIPNDSPFRKLKNVVLSPHLAGASRDIPGHHSRMIVDDLFRFLDGKRPIHLANPEVWKTRRP
jgi:D-3-phosphoglycerate dehydrogenase